MILGNLGRRLLERCVAFGTFELQLFIMKGVFVYSTLLFLVTLVGHG